jgi:hypothetical protein
MGHHSCGTAPESHRIRCHHTGRGICARRRERTAERGQMTEFTTRTAICPRRPASTVHGHLAARAADSII